MIRAVIAFRPAIVIIFALSQFCIQENIEFRTILSNYERLLDSTGTSVIRVFYHYFT